MWKGTLSVTARCICEEFGGGEGFLSAGGRALQKSPRSRRSGSELRSESPPGQESTGQSTKGKSRSLLQNTFSLICRFSGKIHVRVANFFQAGLTEAELAHVVRERDELKDALLDIEKHMEDIQDNVKTLSTERDKLKTLFKQVSFKCIVFKKPELHIYHL